MRYSAEVHTATFFYSKHTVAVQNLANCGGCDIRVQHVNHTLRPVQSLKRLRVTPYLPYTRRNHTGGVTARNANGFRHHSIYIQCVS